MKGTSSLVAPAYTGVALLLSWIYLSFYASSAGIEASAPVSLMSAGYMSSALVMTLTVLLIAFVPFNRAAFLTSPATKVVTPLGLAFSTALLIGGSMFRSPVALVAGGFLTGAFSGIMAQQWIIAFRRVSLKSAICSSPSLMAMAVCVSMTTMYLPRAALYAVIVALPIISELMFHWVRLELFPEVKVESGPRDKPLNFLLVLLPITLCYLASGFLDYFSDKSYYTFAFYALCAFVPFVIAGVFAFVVEGKSFTHSVLIPVAFLVVMGVPILSMHAYVPVAQFISIGELGLEVVIFIVAVAFSEFFNLSSLKVYALVRTCATLFNSVGWYAAQFVERSYSQIASAQFSLLIVFIGIEVLTVCLIVAIVKAQKGVSDDGEGIQGQNNGSIGAPPVSFLAQTNAPTTGIGMKMAVASVNREKMHAGGVDRISTASPMTLDLGANAAGEGIVSDCPSDPSDDGADGFAARESHFEHCCREIAREFELSNREIDVLELLARGYSAARIQKELYIAAGTVNYHTRNIYAKLGVHSKQEVIDLVTRRMGE